jgi:penicillin-binding protein 1A
MIPMRIWRVARWVLLAGALLAVAGGGFGAWLIFHYRKDVPSDLSPVTDYRPVRGAQIYSADDELIGEFFVERRVLVPPDQIPTLVRNAFVAAEDARFFSHAGLDFFSIVRAAVANLVAGHVVQGASTITQQVARLVLLREVAKVGRTMADSFPRKVREGVLSYRIEHRLTKEQILGIYLNHVYLGHGAYGVVAAASAYFGKALSQLTIAEAAMLAAMPKAPSSVTPFLDFPRARARQHYVLDQMVDARFIARAEATAAAAESLVLIPRRRALTNVAAPYFVETVRAHLVEKFGEADVLTAGLKVQTTLVMQQQRAADAAVHRGLNELSKRLRFAGPIRRLGAEDRARLGAGHPRPIGPFGFQVEDDPEENNLVVPLPDDKAALIEPGGKLVVAEGQAAAARAAQLQRKPLAPSADPETLYAAFIAQLGTTISLRTGQLVATLDREDAARITGWTGPAGEKLAIGDVLPVYLHSEQSGKALRWVASLSTAPVVQSALVALDPHSGHLLAMVGGAEFATSQFNRARQAHRQIGSAIKPFIYAAAVDKGMTPVTIKYDVPVAFKTSSGVWAPHNYKGDYQGPLTLWTALAKSVNTIAAQLVAEIGVDAVVDAMKRDGITSPLPRALSLALGTADLSLEEMAYGLAAFPNGGTVVKPVSILKITDGEGRVLEDNTRTAPPVMAFSPETAYVVTDLMKAVTEVGTGKRASELGRPVAGKTGTSTNYRDAWFFGFTPDLLCGVWVGRDDFKPIAHGATGGTVALPIWLAFMQQALAGRPARDFPPAPGIIFARASTVLGIPAKPGEKNSRLIPFKRGTLPAAFRASSAGSRLSDAEF